MTSNAAETTRQKLHVAYSLLQGRIQKKIEEGFTVWDQGNI